MNNIYYKTNESGQLISVHPVEEDLNSLLTRFKDMQSEINTLSEENRRLKSSAYKDLELQKLDAKIKDLEHKLHVDSFYVLKEDREKAEEWAKEHSKICKNYSKGYSYRFYPIPGIGCCGEIYCEKCDSHFNFCLD